jgi:hypothetical protein
MSFALYTVYLNSQDKISSIHLKKINKNYEHIFICRYMKYQESLRSFTCHRRRLKNLMSFERHWEGQEEMMMKLAVKFDGGKVQLSLFIYIHTLSSSSSYFSFCIKCQFCFQSSSSCHVYLLVKRLVLLNSLTIIIIRLSLSLVMLTDKLLMIFIKWRYNLKCTYNSCL